MKNIAQDISSEFHRKVKRPLAESSIKIEMSWYAFEDVEFYGTELYHDILDQQMFIGWWKLYQNK
jgi:hypothetical protein